MCTYLLLKKNGRILKIPQVLDYQYIWYRPWGFGKYQPYLLTCRVPGSHRHKTPVAVSLVKGRCDQARNRLQVVFDHPERKKRFAVCVVGMTLVDDLSVRVVEWVELLGLLGVSKIFLYRLFLHPNLEKVTNKSLEYT
jgi:hypothetical protein